MAELKLGTTIGGSVAWHEGNDGSGSGLDADYLDGNHASAFALSGHTHTYDVNNEWLRDNGDDANVKLYGNSRQMAFRTDGTTEYASGVGGYPFAWMYGGNEAAQRLMLLNTTGDMWTSTNGWLSTALAGKQNTGSYLTAESDTLATVTGRGATTATLLTLTGSAVSGGGTAGNPSIQIQGTSAYQSLELGVIGGYDGMLRTYGNDMKYYAGHWRTAATATENHSHYWYTSKASATDWSTVKMSLNHDAQLYVLGTIRSEGNHYINNSSPTLFLQDTDHRSAMIHVNSNIFYVLRGDSTNGTSWAQFDSYWPLTINLEDNTADFGGRITKRGVNVPALHISDGAPSAYNSADLWWESDTGKLKIYYNDGNTSQWVDAMPIPDTSTFFSKAGGGITGPVNLNSSFTITGTTFSKKTNITANGAGWDDHLNLYSSDATNRWNVLVDSGASNRLRFAYNNTEKFYVNTDGSAWHAGSLSASNLSGTNTGDQTNISGYAAYVTGNNTSTIGKLIFYGDGGNSGQGWAGYGLYQEAGAWSNPFPDLVINYHTGIKIGSYYGYNGTRFYNNNGSSNDVLLASVGDGDYNFRSYYNVIAYASDKRLKENVINIDNALHKVMQLNGVTFDWKKEVKDLGFSPTSWHECGVLAQEVEAVLPEAVEIAPFDYDWKAEDGSHSKSGQKYLTVKYEKIVPLLIEAMKEQQLQIQAQQDQINQLMNLVKEMKNEI